MRYLSDAQKKNSVSRPQYFVTGWIEGGFEKPDDPKLKLQDQEKALAEELGHTNKFIVVKPYLNH